MAINKKALKKRYAKNVYKKRRQAKSSIPTAVSAITAYSRNNNNQKSTNEDAAHSALSASTRSVKFTAKQITHLPKSEMINFLDNKTASSVPYLSRSENISAKSSMLSSMSSDFQNNNKEVSIHKRTYNRNRKRIYKNIRNRNAIAVFKKTLLKNKAIKKALLVIKSLASSKILLILAVIVILSFVVIEPIVLFTTFFASSSGNFVQDYLIDVIAGYPFGKVCLALTWFVIIPFIKYLSTDEGRIYIQQKVESFGIFAPLLFILLEITQIILALIPGGPVEMIGGVLFGAIGGLVLCEIGIFLATVIIYNLVKKFGRPLVNAFVSEEKFKKFKFLHDEKKLELIVFIILMIPGTPKDVITYMTSI